MFGTRACSSAYLRSSSRSGPGVSSPQVHTGGACGQHAQTGGCIGSCVVGSGTTCLSGDDGLVGSALIGIAVNAGVVIAVGIRELDARPTVVNLPVDHELKADVGELNLLPGAGILGGAPVAAVGLVHHVTAGNELLLRPDHDPCRYGGGGRG